MINLSHRPYHLIALLFIIPCLLLVSCQLHPVNAGDITEIQDSREEPSTCNACTFIGTLESEPTNSPESSVTTQYPAAVPPEPTPSVKINGGVVHDGPFTFFLWIYQDPSLIQNPATTSLYSDLNGYGAYLFWVYQGPDLPGPIVEWYGSEPNLQELDTYSGLKTNNQGGRSGGILLPGGFFTPGKSNPGDHVKLVIKLVASDRIYGAYLTFTLQNGPNGWEPEGVGVPWVLE